MPNLTITLTLTFDLNFQSLRATVMTNTHAKGQGQMSVGSKDKVETNKQSPEAIALPPVQTWSVVML